MNYGRNKYGLRQTQARQAPETQPARGLHADGRHEYATDNFLHAVYFTEQTANNGNQHAFQ